LCLERSGGLCERTTWRRPPLWPGRSHHRHERAASAATDQEELRGRRRARART
jgi:hypothetical protein